MILCLDIGNTHIFGGLYQEGQIQLQFRYPSATPATSDQLGVFFKSVLRENNIDPSELKQVSICSVVPSINYSIRSAFLKYFSLEPFFLDGKSVKTLKIIYPTPNEIGADRISNAIAAIHDYPNKNIIVIDLGTATTFDGITANGEYLGGIIMPGLYISMKALAENTAKLSPVTIVKPEKIIGKNTMENIQAGLFYNHLGAMREIIRRMKQTTFNNEEVVVLGTGGFASLFAEEAIFTAIVPELVLQGLYLSS